MTLLTSSAPYFENAAGQLREEAAGYIRTIWHAGPRTMADTQALFGQMALGLQRRGWSRVLADQRQMQPFSSQEQAWVTEQWLPQAVRRGGYRHGAVLVSPNVMVRLATAFITTPLPGLPILYRSFDTDEAAVAWLLQQPRTPQGQA